MAPGRSSQGLSGNPFSRRGIHAAESDVSIGEKRFYAVLYLFCLEEYEARADGILHGARPNAGAGVFSPESLAEYARYSKRVSAERRTPGIYRTVDPGGHAWRQLRDLRSSI